MELLLHQLLVVPQPEVLLLRRPRRRKRKKVRIAPQIPESSKIILTFYIAKEESDEDMGFGLFD